MGAFTSKSTKTTAPAISAMDRTVLDLKNSRDRLQRYRAKLAKDDEKLVEQARKAKLSGRKETALGILRLRKYKQAQAGSCEDQLLNVLKMVETIDSKRNDAEVLAAMKSGKDTLKKMHEETTVDDVLNLMDEIQEAHATEQEVTDILQGVPTLSASDEEAVEAELEALRAEMEQNELPSLPVAPTDTLPQQEAATPATTKITAAKPERVAVPG